MIRALILGCRGPTLEPDEAAFFAEAAPLGFILFRRNCETPDQIRALVAALRDAVGRADAPVLIDQEGGRVARLGPPHWRRLPPAALIGAAYARSPADGLLAARLAGRLLADDLAPLGITVDCAPVADLPAPDGHAVIGDRAFARDVGSVAALARALMDGLLQGGVLPVIKHLPGHGRARADSHRELPVVETDRATLEASDFAVFRALADAPLGMTAHVLYTAVDPAEPATLSARLIAEVIRGSIGFDGFLMSDDIGMGALGGALPAGAEAALRAGCDAVLHCSGDLAEMRAVAAAAGPLSEAAAGRWRHAAALIRPAPPFPAAEAATALARIVGGPVG